MNDTVLYEKKGKVATITLNRPDKLNAINMDVMAGLISAIDQAEDDDDVNSVILQGAGRSFCTGADLNMIYFIYGGGTGKEGERRPAERTRLRTDRKMLWEPYTRLLQCWKPTIARVQGDCIGLGLLLVECCDLAIVAEDCRMGHPEQRLAFGGASSLLVHEFLQLGPKKAKELLLTGMMIDGKEAERINLVNKAVALDKLDAEVSRYAEAIAMMPRDAIAMGKIHSQMAYETLGSSASAAQMYIMHSFCTNLRFEDDEFNFVRARRDKGVKAGFQERDARWAKLGF